MSTLTEYNPTRAETIRRKSSQTMICWTQKRF